jgi:hypothetical protein
MKMRIIGQEAYHILCDNLPIPFPFGKNGEQPPIIVLNNGEVSLIRDLDFHYGDETIVKLSWLIKDIDEKSKTNWRNDDYKKTYIGFYESLIKLMVAYQREHIIDGVLRKEIDYQNWYC